MIFIILLLSTIFTGCSDNQKIDINLNRTQKDFIDKIYTERYLDEGPFRLDYHLRTILRSDNVVSLFGNIFVYNHLPHGWTKYEGKTFVKKDGVFKKITLEDLFPEKNQKEFLRNYCEAFYKSKPNDCCYFQGPNPLCDYFDQQFINTFVVDHESLILIFQPYTVGGLADEPFFVKIPFGELRGKWQPGNLLERQLPITKNFISSWNEENQIYDIRADHSIVMADYRSNGCGL